MLPAVGHEFGDRSTRRGDLRVNPFLNELDHFFVGEPGVWLLTKREDLPEKNAECPDVCVSGERTIED